MKYTKNIVGEFLYGIVIICSLIILFGPTILGVITVNHCLNILYFISWVIALIFAATCSFLIDLIFDI